MRVVVVASARASGRVDEFADASDVVARIEVVVGSLLLSLGEETFCRRAARRVPFFAEFFAAPEKTRVGGDYRILFLDNADAAAEAVIAELAAVGAVVDGGEAVLGIPLERAGAVAGHVPVGVMREALRGAGNRDFINC